MIGWWPGWWRLRPHRLTLTVYRITPATGRRTPSRTRRFRAWAATAAPRHRTP